MFFRVAYDDVGIYEALKRLIWDNNSNFSKKDWEDFKASCDVNWLNVPKVYGDNNYSYFTEKGFDMFLQRTYPLIIKWLDKGKIKFNNRLEKLEKKLKNLSIFFPNSFFFFLMKYCLLEELTCKVA